MAYGNFDMVQNQGSDAMGFLADEIFNGSRGYAVGPERALMSALLFDGVQSYMNYAMAESPSLRSRYREAFNWINTRGAEYIFSFDSVCEALGIDCNFLRFGLLNACNTRVGEWKKTRRNF